MIYLIHFERPFHHCRHYLGFTAKSSKKAVARRLARHLAGHGSRLLKAVAAAGIAVEVVRTWPKGTRDDERKMKKGKNGPALCPVCRELKKGK